MVLREREERKRGGKGMAEGGGDRQGGTEIMDGVSESEPYPDFFTSIALEAAEAWKNTGGGSMQSVVTSADRDVGKRFSPVYASTA